MGMVNSVLKQLPNSFGIQVWVTYNVSYFPVIKLFPSKLATLKTLWDETFYMFSLEH